MVIARKFSLELVKIATIDDASSSKNLNFRNVNGIVQKYNGCWGITSDNPWCDQIIFKDNSRIKFTNVDCEGNSDLLLFEIYE